MNHRKNTSDGILVALAWPETKCKQAGTWYDGLMRWMGFNHSGYYHVGHAALVLIDPSDGACHYYDFGRYHSPHGHGRVRSAYTDHDLKLSTQAQIVEGKLTNLDAILEELYHNPSTHGDGTIYGNETSVNLHKTKRLIHRMIDRVFIPYGPFVRKGTNCSRFVNQALLAGHASLWVKIRLYFPWTISPSPIEILKVLGREAIRKYGISDGHVVFHQEESSIINPVSHEITQSTT